jgi:hypothetical protein
MSASTASATGVICAALLPALTRGADSSISASSITTGSGVGSGSLNVTVALPLMLSISSGV